MSKTQKALKAEDLQSRILAFYHSNGQIELSEKDTAVMERQAAAYDMFLHDVDCKFSKRDTIKKHAALHKQSELQSRHDLDHACTMFGRLDEQARPSHRAISIEMAMQTYRKAEKDNNQSEMNRANKLYQSATGVDRDDPNVPKASDLVIPVLEMPDELTRLLTAKILQVMKGNTMDMQKLTVIELIDGIDFTVLDTLIDPEKA